MADFTASGNNTVFSGTDEGERIQVYDAENVTVNAGDGNDTIITFDETEPRNVVLNGEDGDDYFENQYGSNVAINGGAGNDTIVSYTADVTIDAGSGDDLVSLVGSNIKINLGEGNDTIFALESIINGNGDTLVTSEIAVNGGAGDDVISINSNYGATLEGGNGDDTIFGTKGADVFVHVSGDGNDVIKDFDGTDVLKIYDGSIDSYSISGGDLVLKIGDGSITMKNMANHYITVEDSEGNQTTQKYGNATSQNDIAKTIMQALSSSSLTAATEILDEAIKATNTTVFSGIQDALDKFKAAQASAGDANTFLEDYCGIFLNNQDTGAITGWDAGGSTVKNAEDIVPESGELSAPTGSSFTVNGLTITYNSEDLSTNDQMIVNGLYSWWMGSALDLIYESYGLDFANGSPSYNTMELNFENTNDGTLAYVASTYSTGIKRATSAELVVNLNYYSSLSADDVNGTGSDSSAERIFSSGR